MLFFIVAKLDDFPPRDSLDPDGTFTVDRDNRATNGDGAVDFVEVEIFEGPEGVIHTGDDFGRFVTLLNTTPARSPRCVR